MKKYCFMAMVMTLLIAACSPAKNKLTVWIYLGILDEIAVEHYVPDNKETQIDYFFMEHEQINKELEEAFSSGRGAPDVFIVDDSYFRTYVESGLLMDLTDIYEDNRHNLLDYPARAGSYQGRIYALPMDICPGAMFYRCSLARKYLGTDDPKKVQVFFADFDRFLETAMLLKYQSNGVCVTVAGMDQLYRPFLDIRKNPWVVNNSIVIDPVMEKYMDICKSLYDEGLDGRTGLWFENWFEGMRGRLKDEEGNVLETFAYFLPEWGFRYVLKTYAPDTSGDWAMIPGPAPYYMGGSWICASKNARNPKVVRDFIRFLTTDVNFLEAYAIAANAMVSNLNVLDRLNGNYSDPFIGGQDYYAEFMEMARHINSSTVQSTDDKINDFFMDAVRTFAQGEKTKAKAISDFKQQAEDFLSEKN
jgi:ABC-type glycerol-3-phosphate transport system substrate-binding protein